MEKNDSLKRNALLIAALSSFLTPFMGSSVIVSLPTISRDLAMDAISLSWVSTAFLLSAAACLMPFGRASDIYGRKKIFIFGVMLDNISSILGAMARSGSFLIACRVLQGVGGAMILGTGISIVTAVYPAKDRGKALGIVLTATYVGLTLGPFIGGFLTDYLGWRSIFLSNVLIGLVIIVTAIWKINEEWAEARGETFDFAGSIIYVLSLVLTMYGLSLLPTPLGFMLLLSGIGGFVCFILWISNMLTPYLPGGRIDFCSMHDIEYGMTVTYLEDTARQAGLAASSFPISEIGWNGQGFVGPDDAPLQSVFKLYPWEWMMKDAFATHLGAAPTIWIEPAWKMLLSNKGLLPVLWQLHRGTLTCWKPASTVPG